MSNKLASNTLSGFFFALMIALPIQAQSQNARPSFEVASVKSVGFDGRVTMAPQPNGLSAWGVTARMLIRNAYRVPEFQIEGGPTWINEDRFAVEAKASKVGPGELPLMIQSLLEDRFKLKVHHETRELPVYALVADKNGPRLKLAANQDTPPEQRGFNVRDGLVEGSAVNITQIVNVLRTLTGRPVLDQTGATGLFDIHLEWTADINPANPFGPGGPDVAPPADSSGLTLFSALQQQLGLKLQSTKGPVDIIVIDGIEKPSEN
jgi:uncharacterized protein (TIGR03435 family)